MVLIPPIIVYKCRGYLAEWRGSGSLVRTANLGGWLTPPGLMYHLRSNTLVLSSMVVDRYPRWATTFAWSKHAIVGPLILMKLLWSPWIKPTSDQCMGCLQSVFPQPWHGLVTWHPVGSGWVTHDKVDQPPPGGPWWPCHITLAPSVRFDEICPFIPAFKQFSKYKWNHIIWNKDHHYDVGYIIPSLLVQCWRLEWCVMAISNLTQACLLLVLSKDKDLE
jgi:hypothetical protein